MNRDCPSRQAAARQLLAEKGLEALVVVGVPQIGEGRGNGWLGYLFDYHLDQRYAYGVLGADAGEILVLPVSLRWTTLSDVPCELVISNGGGGPLAGDLLEPLRCVGARSRIGVIGLAQSMPLADYELLTAAGFELLDVSAACEPLRALKSAEEEAAFAHSYAIAFEAMEAVRETLEPGVRLTDVHAAVQETLAARGSRATHVLFSAGADGAGSPWFGSPYDAPRVFEPDDVVCWSIELAGPTGYWVELAETFVLGQVRESWRRSMEVIDAMMDLFVRRAVPGTAVLELYHEIEEVARACGCEIGHGIGHGIGRDLIEAPGLARGEPATFQAGMALAFHPHLVGPGPGEGAYAAATYVVDRTEARPPSATPIREASTR